MVPPLIQISPSSPSSMKDTTSICEVEGLLTRVIVPSRFSPDCLAKVPEPSPTIMIPELGLLAPTEGQAKMEEPEPRIPMSFTCLCDLKIRVTVS